MVSLEALEDRYWRKDGYVAVNAQVNCPQRKEDLGGFIDRVYLGPNGHRVYVQVTRTDHMGARIEKILTGHYGHGKHRVRIAEIARRILIGDPGSLLLVVGWQKNEAKWKYERTVEEVELGRLETELE